MEPLTVTECEAYQVLLGFAAHMLRGSLSRDGLSQVASLAPTFAEEPFASVAPEDAAAFAQAIDPATRGGDEADALFHELRQDYAYLFYSIPLSGCSPYESVYRTPDRTMFGPTTFEVREAYRAWGLELATDEHTPDDHVATEFEFAASLLALMTAGGDEAARAQEALVSFLSQHVLVFAPALLDRVAEVAQTPAYQAAARIAGRSLASLAARLGAQAVEDALSQPGA